MWGGVVHVDFAGAGGFCPPLLTSAKPKEEIEAILDNQLVSICRGGYQKFLVKWKHSPMSNYSWLQMEEVQHLNPDMTIIKLDRIGFFLFH